jgi:hypothetical protein
MMISHVKGIFSGLSGVLRLDETDYTHSVVEVSIQAASVRTVDDKLNAHLKEADFFDVEKFPTLTFKFTSIRSLGDRDYEVNGDLTIRGVTKSVVLSVNDLSQPSKDPWGNQRIGLSASAKNQSQGIWAGVECTSGIRRSPGWGRSGDHTRCAVHQGIARCADSIQIMGGIGRLQSTGTEANRDEGECDGNCKRTYQIRADEHSCEN